MSQLIQKLKFPIKNSDIYHCSKFVCVCVEYLDFSKKKNVNYYRQCMITDLKNTNRISQPTNYLPYRIRGGVARIKGFHQKHP